MKEYEVNIPVSTFNQLTTSCVILANCGVLSDNLIKMMKSLFNTCNIVPTKGGKLKLNNLTNLKGSIPEYSVELFKGLMAECFPTKKYEINEVIREDEDDEEDSENDEEN